MMTASRAQCDRPKRHGAGCASRRSFDAEPFQRSVSSERTECLPEHHERRRSHSCCVPRFCVQARRQAVHTAMTSLERLVLWLAGAIARAAYVAALCLQPGRSLGERLGTTRGWRTVEFGPLRIRVPPGWGEVERTPDGGYVVHNRPSKDRIDGDAVWYSSAIELRIRRPDMRSLPRLAPMKEVSRLLQTGDGPVVVALQIANGVGPLRRREARRVLRLARAVRGAPFTWSS